MMSLLEWNALSALLVTLNAFFLLYVFFLMAA